MLSRCPRSLLPHLHFQSLRCRHLRHLALQRYSHHWTQKLMLGSIKRAVRDLRINVVHCTPSILAVVPLEHYPTLQTVVVASEALGKKSVED